MRNELNNEVSHLFQSSPSPYIHLLSRLVNPFPPSRNRYINIDDRCLKTNRSLMQQVHRTILAERRGIHGLAYNHLLNTLQEWCFCNQQLAIDRNYVVSLLESIASHAEIVFVITMLDRRNRNIISHPGDESVEVATVDQTEYEEHLTKLNYLLHNFWRWLP